MRSKLTFLAVAAILVAAVFPFGGNAGGAAYMLGQKIGILEADNAEQNRAIYLLQKRVACLEIRVKRPNYRCGPMLLPIAKSGN